MLRSKTLATNGEASVSICKMCKDRTKKNSNLTNKQHITFLYTVKTGKIAIMNTTEYIKMIQDIGLNKYAKIQTIRSIRNINH